MNKTLENIKAISEAFRSISTLYPNLNRFSYELPNQPVLDVIDAALQLDIPLFTSPDDEGLNYSIVIDLPNGTIEVWSVECTESISKLLASC